MSRKLKIIISAILSVVFIISAIMIATEIITREKEKNEFLELAQEAEYTEPQSSQQASPKDEPAETTKYEYKPKNLTVLFEKNNECVAWLTVPESVINYPVMHTVDNPEKYLNKNFEGEKSNSGVPFIDYRCNLQNGNIIIYGHNMKNGTMFGSLKKYKDKQYKKEHQIIYLQTADRLRKFSVIEAKSTTVNDQIYNDLSATAEPKLILSTCYGNSEVERFIVIAKEIL